VVQGRRAPAAGNNAVAWVGSASVCPLLMSTSLFLLVLVGVLATVWATPNAGCAFGGVDLSALIKGAGGGDYTGSDAKYTYKMNVCGTCNAGPGCTDKGYSVCQYEGSNFVANLGSFTGDQPTWAFIGGSGSNGVQYTFTNGDLCYIAGQPRTRTVNVLFPCSGSTESGVTVTEDETTCTFAVTLKTDKSCPGGGGGGGSGGGMSGGTIFIILALSLTLVYIAAGCLYKNRKQGAHGIEACPQYEFWKDVPGLVKDGFRFTISGCKKKNYTQI